MARKVLGTKGRPINLADLGALSYWLDTAPKGEWACYWRGDLAMSREGGLMIPQGRTMLARQLGKALWESYELGRVCLVQARYGTAGFAYFAVKRDNPYPVPAAALGGRSG
jgi:hypothetical protein